MWRIFDGSYGFSNDQCENVPRCRYDSSDDCDHAAKLGLDKFDYANAVEDVIEYQMNQRV